MKKQITQVFDAVQPLQQLVVLGFPGVGKTHLSQVLNAHDSDSSAFSWLSPGVRHPDFPANYIAHIKTLKGVVFASSHKVVRDGLRENDIPFVLCHPEYSLKEEYLKRYEERGSPKAFIDTLNTFWESWLSELYQERASSRIILRENEHLSNYAPMLKAMLENNWVSVKLMSGAQVSDTITFLLNYLHQNHTIGVEYGLPKSGDLGRTCYIDIVPSRVCCILKSLGVTYSENDGGWLVGKVLPFGLHEAEIRARLVMTSGEGCFYPRYIAEKNKCEQIFSFDYKV